MILHLWNMNSKAMSWNSSLFALIWSVMCMFKSLKTHLEWRSLVSLSKNYKMDLFTCYIRNWQNKNNQQLYLLNSLKTMQESFLKKSTKWWMERFFVPDVEKQWATIMTWRVCYRQQSDWRTLRIRRNCKWTQSVLWNMFMRVVFENL